MRLSTNLLWRLLSLVLLTLFSLGMVTNLDNIAFWEDEGETVQLGKSILTFGYPSVFDGRSFILLDDNFDPKTFLRNTSPYLQFYVAAVGWLLTGGVGDTGLLRFPFALIATIGVWSSFFIFRKLKYSPISLFLYALLLSSSVQTYLYWRQARHYALQFPLALGFLYSYLNLGKRKWNIFFLLFGFLFYHAYYPGFVGFYVAILIHALIRKCLDRSYRLKPLVVNTVMLLSLHLPTAVYFRHFGQLPNNGYFNTLAAYLMDLNYFTYFKVAVISIVAIVVLKRPNLSVAVKRLDLAVARSNLETLFSAYGYSLSLFSLVIMSHILLASLGAHNARYASVLFPFTFLIVAVSWDGLVSAISQKVCCRKPMVQLLGFPILVALVLYSHPNFIAHLTEYAHELKSEYYGPIEGIVNTINGVRDLSRINPYTSKQPNLLVATNFEDGAIYSYLDNQFLNALAPKPHRTGTRLPDWVIIRKDWGQKEYLTSFLKRGEYERIETEYCDLKYQNTYLVRTHLFQSVTDCPDRRLVLYRLVKE